MTSAWDLVTFLLDKNAQQHNVDRRYDAGLSMDARYAWQMFCQRQAFESQGVHTAVSKFGLIGARKHMICSMYAAGF